MPRSCVRLELRWCSDMRLFRSSIVGESHLEGVYGLSMTELVSSTSDWTDRSSRFRWRSSIRRMRILSNNQYSEAFWKNPNRRQWSSIPTNIVSSSLGKPKLSWIANRWFQANFQLWIAVRIGWSCVSTLMRELIWKASAQSAAQITVSSRSDMWRGTESKGFWEAIWAIY